MADAAITEISDAELVSMLNDAKKELFNLRFQMATGQLDNTTRISQVKREVARAKTEMRSREIAAAEKLALEPLAQRSAGDES
ncbi:MAG: 50S ribosomal protein L29 [Acidimicrobiia bacterium]|nr:50S ribosomal protein L29 [Acidimicrobiia bacterium]MDH5520914.1 50S ribosomal protein L29 [Acidimicrobiia bacterium]